MSVYSARQVRCMEAIGLVPWVRRCAVQAAPVARASAAELSEDQTSESTPLLTGNLNAKILLVFTHWPLDKPDSALLDGMLRAIGLSSADVCFVSIDSASDLNSLTLTPTLKHFLFFGSADVAEDDTHPIALEISNDQLNGWQLPSLSTLRKQPQRKRQAWITLKSLRSSLDRY